MRSISKTLLRTPSTLWSKAAGFALYRARHSNVVSDTFLFLKTWRKHPGKVGAILPSGPALCEAITREINAAHAPILELGCGTGVFTQKIIERGVFPQDLVLIELDPFFANNLHLKFPRAHVLCADACRLHLMPIGLDHTAGAAVCGLPLRNMSTKQQCRILQGAFSTLRTNGALYLFSYGWRCPVPLPVLDRLGLRARKLNTVLLNVPPARIWKITRQQEVDSIFHDVSKH